MAKKTTKRAAAKPAPNPHHTMAGQAFLHSLFVVIYIVFVSYIMVNSNALFGTTDNTVIGPISFLLLFTLSAAIVGLLVFGRPVMYYLDGRKRDALQFVGAVVGFLFIEALIVFIVLALVNLQ